VSLHRRAAKRDDSEPEVVEALERHGAKVQKLSGEDVPDLLVALRGVNWLVEVKTGNAKLKPGQAEWHATWPGLKPVILRNRAQADAWARTACMRLENVVRSLPIEAALGVRDGEGL
jgi:hypothetical protein